MTTNLQVDEQFPDIELPNHQNELTRLSQCTRPSLLDKHLQHCAEAPRHIYHRSFHSVSPRSLHSPYRCG
jgi:hypothetical protein